MTRLPYIKPTVPRMAAVGSGPPRFWLVLETRRVSLAGTMTVGRSPQCEITLDDPLASRRHARLTVTADGVVVEDLGSANGLVVDGRLVKGERMLLGGEKLRVGQTEMMLQAGGASDVPPVRQAAITLDGAEPPTDDDVSEDPTAPVQDALAIVGAVIEKALARDDLAEAGRLLVPVLRLLGEEAAVSGTVDPERGAKLARYTLDLAERTRRGEWIGRLVELYRGALRPLPAETVDRLYGLVRKVDMVPVPALQDLCEALSRIEARFGPSERFAMKRLEGLVKIAKG